VSTADRRGTERLLELAEWVLGGIGAPVEYAQVFAETALWVKSESMAGKQLATCVEPREGLGCLILRDGIWRFKAVPPTRIPGLVDWLGVTAAGPAPCWRTSASAEGFTPLPADEWLLPESPVRDAAPSIRAVEDFVCRDIAVADTEGVRSVRASRTVRHRVEATVAAGGRRYRGLSRWLRNCDEARGHPGAGALSLEALRQASEAAAATMEGMHQTPVVFETSAAAGFLHELVGHALEADNFDRGSDYLTRLRKPGTVPHALTLRDDPSVAHGYGSYQADDEGMTARAVTLLENGEIGTPLTTVRAARHGGHQRTANGRREDYRCPAIPRATNTVAAAGADDPAALGQDSRTGVLRIGGLGAGMINLATGEFSFAALDCSYVTPAGNVLPVRDVSLVGDAVDVLSRLEGIGSDFGGDNVTCGKQGQNVGIGIYSPSMRYAAIHWSAG
jgi:predicted Zn-dependent protease